MKKVLLALAGATVLAGGAAGDIVLFDIDRDPDGWDAALREKGKVVKNSYDFDNDADYGILGFDGPLTSAGGGPVSPGILPDKVTMDRINLGGASPGLVAVGPSAGFGNPSNAVLANFFVDAFAIWVDNTDNPKTAFEFNALTLLGSNVVDITAIDDAGNRFVFAGVNVGAGRNLGLLVQGDGVIAHVEIFDPGGGAEGVQGAGAFYLVPAPGALALLGVAGLVARRRRR